MCVCVSLLDLESQFINSFEVHILQWPSFVGRPGEHSCSPSLTNKTKIWGVVTGQEEQDEKDHDSGVGRDLCLYCNELRTMDQSRLNRR